MPEAKTAVKARRTVRTGAGAKPRLRLSRLPRSKPVSGRTIRKPGVRAKFPMRRRHRRWRAAKRPTAAKMTPIHSPDARMEEKIATRVQEALAQADQDKYNRSYNEGFKKGFYAGGDSLVDQSLPHGQVLPEVPVSEIVLAGIGQMQHRLHSVMGTEEVVTALVDAMDRKLPLAVVRLGDGELLTMAQDTVMPVDQVREEGSFLPYAGVTVPDLSARDQLVQAISGPAIVGIPLLRVPNFQHLAFAVIRAYGLDYRLMRLTHSTINYAIYLEHGLPRIVTGRRVLIVGNKAGPLADIFRANGVDVVDAIAPVNGVADVDRVMAEVAARDFDIALVSAGIAAVILCHRISAEYGKVAVDFGHLADSMVKGEAPYA